MASNWSQEVTLRVVTSDAHLGQSPGEEVELGRIVPAYDTPLRVGNIRAALALSGHFETVAPTEHGRGPIEAVHDRAMLDWLDTIWAHWRSLGHTRPFFPSSFAHHRLLGGGGRPPRCPANPLAAGGYWTFDTSTGIVEGSASAWRGSVDIALTATDRVLAGERAAYGLCRPPGHHASSDLFGGFCFVNNAAIAARYAQSRGAGRIAIVDVDYHHGNGTQSTFYEDASVLVVNLHADPSFEYPYFLGHADETGAGAGAGTNLNLPMPAGTGDGVYLEALDQACQRVLEAEPDLLLVSLGVDGYVRDPICSFALTTPGFRRIGERFARLDLPTVVLQEGGYAVAEIGDNVAGFLCGLAGYPPAPAAATMSLRMDRANR